MNSKKNSPWKLAKGLSTKTDTVPRENKSIRNSHHVRIPAYGLNTSQLDLFDRFGHGRLNVVNKSRVLQRRELTSTLRIYGMTFELRPKPKNCQVALEITLDAIRVLHLARKEWVYSSPGHILPIQLETRKCLSCTVTFRTSIDDKIIRSSYTHSSDHLELSIPSPKLWQTSGLNWLNRYVRCCDKNAENPRPWLMQECDCHMGYLADSL